MNKDPVSGEIRTAKRICSICEACCGLEIKIQGEKVLSIRGNADDKFSLGYICPKGVAIKDLHEDPDRLRHPLIKRNSKFVEATWSEAFSEIAERLPPILKQHGHDSCALYFGNPVAHKAGLLLYTPRLAKAIGSRNIFSASSVDQMPKQLSSGLMFGHWLSIAVPDIERTDLLVVLGGNPMVSNGSLWTVPDFRGKARALRERGGRLIVVDPRRTETSDIADEHYFIRPGSDVYLLLAIVNTLFADGLLRLGRLEPYLNGVPELQEACAAFTPEIVAARCGIETDAIRKLAHDIASAKHAAVYGRIGTCTQDFGTLCSWLVDVVNILTGHFDEPGGMMFPKAAAFAANTFGKPGSGRGIVTGRYKSRVSGVPEVYSELPASCLAEEILTGGEGQVRAMICVAGNPVLSTPNGAKLEKALETLEFMVSVDIYVNETSRHADVILPGNSPLEESHFDVAFPQFAYRNQARYSQPVFSRHVGQPEEWEILQRLAAIAKGHEPDCDVGLLDDEHIASEISRAHGSQTASLLTAFGHRRGPERLFDFGLRFGPYGDRFGDNLEGLSLARLEGEPDGIDLGSLDRRIPEMLRTPSGKIELVPALLIEDLKRVASDLRQPAPEMVVIGRRDVRSNNSWMHNLHVLAKGPFRCTAKLNPKDGLKYGLQTGSIAHVSRDTHTIEVQVELSDEMMPGVISIPHGWGHNNESSHMGIAKQRPGANLNLLFDEKRRDVPSGNAVLGGVAVKVRPAERAT